MEAQALSQTDSYAYPVPCPCVVACVCVPEPHQDHSLDDGQLAGTSI